MKGKFPTIVMAVMALVLSLSLAVVGAGVQPDEAKAGDQSWTSVVTPTIDIALNPLSDINGLALSATFDTDMTMYAAVTDPMKTLMATWIGTFGVVRSTDGGITWTACTEPQNPVGVGPAGPLTIAVAPDDVSYLVATDGATIWASADGGGTWAVYGTAAGIDPAAVSPVITSVDVGPVMVSTHPIVVGIDDIGEPLELIVTTALTGAAATTVTVTYTSQLGTAGRTGTANLTGAEAIGAIVPVTLQGTDTGATDVTAATCPVAYATGVVNIRGTVSATVAGTLTLTPLPGVYADGAVIPTAVDANGVYLWGWGSPPSLSWSPQMLAEDVWAVAFSPNYASDFTIVAVGSPAGATNVHLGDGSTQLWDAASPNYPSWPQVLYGQVSTGACIALPADFNGLLPLWQVAFVGTRGAALASNNDVWRVRFVGPWSLSCGFTGVASLDLVGNVGGSAALMVGDVAPAFLAPYANLAYTTDPWSVAPWWSGANKPPTGASCSAIVALHPDYLTNGEAFCGTGGAPLDESALSKTVDSGLTWNQISLVDTDINVGIADLAPSPDYASDSTLFLATCSTTTPWDSLWKSTMGGAIWERIDVMNTTNDTAIVSVSPNYGTDTTIYWAETDAGANRIRVSTDGGGFFWAKTVGWAAGVGINDMVVEDGTTLYVASAGSVGKSIDSGSTWPLMGSTGMDILAMVQDPGTGHLAMSGSGEIYLCTDTTTMTINPVGTIPGAGLDTIQWLAFSNNYATDNTLYIADGGAAGGIWKLVVGAPPPFQIHALPASGNATGIVMGEGGVLYCADAAPGAGGWRSLDPWAAVPEFTQLTAGLVSLPVPPVFTLLRLATGASNILWAVDTANPILPPLLMDRLMTYTDTDVPSTLWSVPMIASTASEGSNPNLEFGTDASATDGYDSGIDAPHPPPSPGATFDAYFESTNPLFPRLDKDYRGPSDGIEWTLHVESDSEDITIIWDAGGIPAGLSLYMDTGISVVDLKAQSSTTLLPGEYSIVISESVEIEITLKAGWNMVSVPVTPVDPSVGSVFAGVEVVYTWNPISRSYYSPTEVEPCKGYWVAVIEDTVIQVRGVPVYSWTRDITAGWNMIGSVIEDVDFTAPQDDPDGSVEPFAYWWDPVTKSYDFTTTIESTKGYWVAATQDCTLTLCVIAPPSFTWEYLVDYEDDTNGYYEYDHPFTLTITEVGVVPPAGVCFDPPDFTSKHYVLDTHPDGGCPGATVPKRHVSGFTMIIMGREWWSNVTDGTGVWFTGPLCIREPMPLGLVNVEVLQTDYTAVSGTVGYPYAVGDKWTSTWYSDWEILGDCVAPATQTLTTEVVAVDVSVTVPAGTFTDCIQLVFTRDGTDNTRTFWVSPSVRSSVKEVDNGLGFDGVETMELLSYNLE